jgi:hypothetical protein
MDLAPLETEVHAGQAIRRVLRLCVCRLYTRLARLSALGGLKSTCDRNHSHTSAKRVDKNQYNQRQSSPKRAAL